MLTDTSGKRIAVLGRNSLKPEELNNPLLNALLYKIPIIGITWKKQLSFVSGVEVPPNAGIEEYKNGWKFMDKEQHDFAIYILQARINLTEETIILTTTSETSFVFKQSTTHMSANKGVKIDNLRLFFEVQTSQKRNIIIIIAHKGVTIVNFCLYFEVQTSQKSKRETYLSN